MAYVDDARYRTLIEEVYGYPVREHRGRALFWIGGTWRNYPFSEYGFAAAEIDRDWLAYAPRPYRLKLESADDAPPFADQAPPPRRLGKLARLDLEPSVAEEAFYRAREHQVRKAVQKAARAGWTAEVAPLRDHLAEFYPRYTRYMQERHGSPPFARRHFEVAARLFGADLVVSRVRRADVTAAWLVGFVDARSSSCQITDIVTLPEHQDDRVADLAHWELVRHARALGLAAFDFGICRYEGQERYKRKWGCRFHDAFVLSSEPGDRPADPDAGFYPLARKAWRHLPHAVHARVGPWLRRRLGV